MVSSVVPDWEGALLASSFLSFFLSFCLSLTMLSIPIGLLLKRVAAVRWAGGIEMDGRAEQALPWRACDAAGLKQGKDDWSERRD